MVAWNSLVSKISHELLGGGGGLEPNLHDRLLSEYLLIQGKKVRRYWSFTSKGLMIQLMHSFQLTSGYIHP